MSPLLHVSLSLSQFCLLRVGFDLFDCILGFDIRKHAKQFESVKAKIGKLLLSVVVLLICTVSLLFTSSATNGGGYGSSNGSEVAELEIEAYPLLDELTSKISTLNLERARQLKSRFLTLTRIVQKVCDEIEQLIDDDGDMTEMYLTEKKSRMEASFYGDQSVMGYRSNDGASLFAPVSHVSSPPDGQNLEKTLSIARS